MFVFFEFPAHPLTNLTDEQLAQVLLGSLGRRAYADDDRRHASQQFDLLVEHVALGEPVWAREAKDLRPPPTGLSLGTAVHHGDQSRTLENLAVEHLRRHENERDRRRIFADDPDSVPAEEPGDLLPSPAFTRLVLRTIPSHYMITLTRWTKRRFKVRTTTLYTYDGSVLRPSDA